MAGRRPRRVGLLLYGEGKLSAGSGGCYQCCAVTMGGGIGKGSAGVCPCQPLSDTFISSRHGGVESVLIKLVGSTQLGGAASTLEDGMRVRNDPLMRYGGARRCAVGNN